MNYAAHVVTLVGRLTIVVSDRALIHMYFPGERVQEKCVMRSNHPLMRKTKKELTEYFAGKRKKFTVPVQVEGTPFQKKAWRVLQKIPYGVTLSYSEQARLMSKQGAVRAVGSANGKNPIPIIVACHRVVAKGAGLGGYAGGLAIKKKLLALEQKFASSGTAH